MVGRAPRKDTDYRRPGRSVTHAISLSSSMVFKNPTQVMVGTSTLGKTTVIESWTIMVGMQQKQTQT